MSLIANNSGGWRGATLWESLTECGVTRRDFMKMCSSLAAIFSFGTPQQSPGATAQELDQDAQRIANALGNASQPNVLWLQLQECGGCVESVLRSADTNVENIVLKLLSLNYNELFTAGAGTQRIAKAMQQPHILVVSGSVPQEKGGVYCTIGGKTAEQVLVEAAEHATAIIAVGACAIYGSVQSARPNPTGAVGVEKIIKHKPVINVAGCPPIGEVIMATMSYLLTYGQPPKLDPEGRPLFAYDQRIHDSCPRRAHYDAGQFVQSFDDAGARNGWCLHKVGCKGPSTFSPCPIIQWNMHSDWPIGAGHPCIGCTEKHFFDRFTPFYSTLPHVPGFGVEASAEKLGWGLIGGAAVAVAVHGGVTAARRISARWHGDDEAVVLTAFGDAPPTPQPTPPDDSIVGRALPLVPVSSATHTPSQHSSGPRHALREDRVPFDNYTLRARER